MAATLNELLDRHFPITVHLPGGDLTVSWDERGHVWKRGRAIYICHGELERDIFTIGSMIDEGNDFRQKGRV